MSLVINTNCITRDELFALSKCDFEKEIIAIKKDSTNDDSKVVILSKSDITFLQLFLKVFGCGKLAHTQINLSKVSSHLSQFNWGMEGSFDKNSDDYQAYLKVCTLANKALYSRKETALFEKVAEQIVNPQDEDYIHYLSIPINPEMQVKHVEAFLKKSLGRSKVKIETGNFDLNKKVTSEDLEKFQFSVPRQRKLFQCFDPLKQRFDSLTHRSDLVGLHEVD
jgi:hypothetical protein